MTSREASSSSGDDRHIPTSRRTFLLAAGSSVGVSLSAAPASGESDDELGDAVTIVVSPSQRRVARDAVDGLRENRSTTTITLHVTETTAGLRRFTAGDVDVLAGSRPILPAERSRAAENGVAYEHREFPTATATLRHPESSWVDCLPPTHLAETWAGDGVVETWAEVAPRAATNEVTRHLPSEEPTARTMTSERRENRTRPTQYGTVLVRGVRAYQYASGFGGIGYYEPNRDWLGRPSEAIERDAESHTPLVRLAFLYVNRESLRRQTVEDFVRAYTHLSAQRVGGVPYFKNPIGGD